MAPQVSSASFTAHPSSPKLKKAALRCFLASERISDAGKHSKTSTESGDQMMLRRSNAAVARNHIFELFTEPISSLGGVTTPLNSCDERHDTKGLRTDRRLQRRPLYAGIWALDVCNEFHAHFYRPFLLFRTATR